MLVYKHYYYEMTAYARSKFESQVDVTLVGYREYPCGTRVPVRQLDVVPEWQRVYREEVEVEGVKVELFTMQDIYGTTYEAFIQHAAPDPRGNGALLVFLCFQAPNGTRPAKLQWTEEQIALELARFAPVVGAKRP